MGSETRRDILKRLAKEYAAERTFYPEQNLFPGMPKETHEELLRRHKLRVEARWVELEEHIDRYVPAAPSEKIRG